MTDPAPHARIIAELEVVQDFHAATEAERRVAFLTEVLIRTGAAGYVLGISGGVDSSTAGRLCQLAVERVRAGGRPARFVAMRLPYGVQADEADAQRALRFIRPDETLTVDIAPATDAMWHACASAGLPYSTRAEYIKGNIKARQRMIAQYAVAGAHGMLVVGTDHAAEAVVGFFTKHGDGAVDLTPLTGLPKRRVKDLARHLGAEEAIVQKVPTADLESDWPLLADEAALGVTYREIDDFLEGKPVSADAQEIILRWHRSTTHKRALPVTPGTLPTGA